MTTVDIRADKFYATVELNMLPTLPIKNLRKLFKLMWSRSYENTEAIQKTEDYLSEAVADAKTEWQKTSADYQNKWIFIDCHGYTIPKAKQQKINRPLIMAVKHAKANYNRLVKIQFIFQETKNKEK